MDQSRMIKFPAGSVILREGEKNADMYRLVHGHAEVYTGYETDHEVLLGIIGPRDCFGEFGLLLKEPAIYTVVAYSDVYAVRITEGEIGDFVAENHKAIVDIMRNMSRMMMKMQHQINLLASEVDSGKAENEELIYETQRNLRDYVLKSTAFKMQGKMRYINRYTNNGHSD